LTYPFPAIPRLAIPGQVRNTRNPKAGQAGEQGRQAGEQGRQAGEQVGRRAGQAGRQGRAGQTGRAGQGITASQEQTNLPIAKAISSTEW